MEYIDLSTIYSRFLSYQLTNTLCLLQCFAPPKNEFWIILKLRDRLLKPLNR